MTTTTYQRFAGTCSILAGVSIFLYSVAFVVLRNGLLSGLFLLASGLLTLPLLVGLYDTLRKTEAGFALLALLLGTAGAVGSAVHGGYDLANAINPPGAIPANTANLPSQIDPRGLLAFGVTGAAVFFFAWLIQHGRQLPRGLAYLGYLLAVLLVVLYVGRLTVLDASSLLILGPALLAGFVVNPIWYLWLGFVFLRTEVGPATIVLREESDMANEENKSIARRYVEGFNTGELSRVEDWIAQDCTFRGPGTPPGRTGPEGYRRIVQIYRNAFPDVHLTIDESTAEGDRVATSWHAEGTHRGDLLGIAPTNKRGHTTGVYILRVSGGKLHDAQIEWDMLGLLQELGVVSMGGQAERRAA